jgi:hypothetical protein
MKCPIHKEVEMVCFCPACCASIRSREKAQAARLNGRKGGRPKGRAIQSEDDVLAALVRTLGLDPQLFVSPGSHDAATKPCEDSTKNDDTGALSAPSEQATPSLWTRKKAEL